MVATVMVITADPSIESLVGELVAFSGYRPVFDSTGGAAGEAIRRSRPDIAMVDLALAIGIAEACISAADDTGCEVVLISSTASAAELEQQGRARKRLCFALPGGPQPLARVLDRAIERKSRRPVFQLALPHSRGSGAGSLHPSFCAALTSVARNRNRSALRAAVADYAAHLKSANVPMPDALALVNQVIRDCANLVGAEAGMTALLRESKNWAQQVYSTA